MIGTELRFWRWGGSTLISARSRKVVKRPVAVDIACALPVSVDGDKRRLFEGDLLMISGLELHR